MMHNPEKVAIVMHEPVPKPILNVIKDSVSIRVPPEHLMITSESDVESKVKNKDLEYISNAISKLNRSYNQSDTVVSVPLYIKDYQIDRNQAKKIVSEMQRLEHIVAFEYYEEKYTDKFYGYCAQVKVKI